MQRTDLLEILGTAIHTHEKKKSLSLEINIKMTSVHFKCDLKAL